MELQLREREKTNTIVAPKKYKTNTSIKSPISTSTDTLEIDTDSFGINSSATTLRIEVSSRSLPKDLTSSMIKRRVVFISTKMADKGFGDGASLP